MALQDWVANLRHRYSTLDLSSATHLTFRETESRFLRFPLNWWGAQLSRTPVFEEDWELLIVLDTCRVDALELLNHEFKYLPSDIPSRYSVGQTSYLWMKNNFSSRYHDEKSRTAHITWNPHSENELESNDWLSLSEVWCEWPEGLRYLPADEVTRAAADVYSEHSPERMIVHYMQPHEPYPALDVNDDYVPQKVLNPDEQGETVFDLIKSGHIGVEVAKFYYFDTLRRVLLELPSLAERLPYDDIVLTADHGESFGEYGFYGHPGSVIHPQTIRVPWARLDRENLRAHGETDEVIDPETEKSAEERLRQLGYLN